MGSLNIACADATVVPAGDALAVDREAFSRAVTVAIEGQPNIEVRREEVTDLALLPPSQGAGVRVIATGPLTSQPLAEAIRTLAGQDHLYFFDAMAPIVMAESIDMSIAWRGNRWSRGAEGQGGKGSEGAGERRSGGAEDDNPSSVGDYINCPLSRDQYYAFVDAVKQAEKISLREFELAPDARHYFEACLPIEVLAARGPDAAGVRADDADGFARSADRGGGHSLRCRFARTTPPARSTTSSASKRISSGEIRSESCA